MSTKHQGNANGGAGPEPESPTEFWTHQARMIAALMRKGGARRFSVWLTPRGSYKFSVDPVEEQNAQRSATEGRP